MKRKLLLACLFIAGMVATQAQNLIKNGSFENGMENWAGGNIAVRNYVATVDGTHYLQSTSGAHGYYNANARYTKEVATNVEGKTYVYSFWVPKTTNVNRFKGRIQVKKSNGESVYELADGSGLGAFDFTATGEEKKVDAYNTWKKLSAVLVLSDDSHTISGLGLSISAEGIKLDNIEFVEVKPLPNLTVTNYQREVLVTWDAVTSTTSYTVQVGKRTPTTVTEPKYLIKELDIEETSSVTVSAEGFASKTLSFKTENFTTKEQDSRIPYVKFMNNEASTSFYPFIFDSTSSPTEVKVFLDGAEVTAGADGFYTLTAGDNKKLKVTFRDGSQAYELIYTVNVK